MNGTVATYRFSQAAAAIGITEAALRNWMTRNKPDLFGERPGGGWRAFTRNDVLVLAVVAELVKFGAPVNAALDAVRTGLATTNFATFEGLPTYLYAAPSEREGLAGAWVSDTDKERLRAITGAFSVVELWPARLIVEARRRLEAIA